MNEMRKLMETVEGLLNEKTDYVGALEARIAKGDKGAKELRYAIQTYQLEGDSDEAFDFMIGTLKKYMPELDPDSEEFWDAIFAVKV